MSDVDPSPLQTAERPDRSIPSCPVDRMPSRSRNRICLRIMIVGGLNFLFYTLMYAAIGGDAHNGYARTWADESGTPQTEYVVSGHFIRTLDGRQRVVGRGVWIYSYVHSISLPLTSGAMIISMLVLARPHILATMRDGWISGPTFVVAFSTIIIVVALAVATVFTWDFVSQLAAL